MFLKPASQTELNLAMRQMKLSIFYPIIKLIHIVFSEDYEAIPMKNKTKIQKREEKKEMKLYENKNQKRKTLTGATVQSRKVFIFLDPETAIETTEIFFCFK